MIGIRRKTDIKIKITKAEQQRYKYDANIAGSIQLPEELSGIIAVRSWHLISGMHIASTNRNSQYDSTCIWADQIPEPSNESGIYACQLPNYNWITSSYESAIVIGIVELAGKIVEHKDGILRGEFCKILFSIAHPYHATRLSKIYGIPCVTANDAAEAFVKLTDWFSSEDGIRCLRWNRQLVVDLQAKRLLGGILSPEFLGEDNDVRQMIPEHIKDKGTAIPSSKLFPKQTASVRRVASKTVTGGIKFGGEGIAIKNTAIDDRYPHGLRGFRRQYACISNSSITLVKRGKPDNAGELLLDLRRNGLIIGDDYVLLSETQTKDGENGIFCYPNSKWLQTKVVRYERIIYFSEEIHC
ncbi:hypothetical protein DGWBC_0615 [Dehalogenimonas sp. WBC-2]|nr:hypothetical protein DGWBC_0615 [Dehalogenimonas sp. WBC-2]